MERVIKEIEDAMKWTGLCWDTPQTLAATEAYNDMRDVGTEALIALQNLNDPSLEMSYFKDMLVDLIIMPREPDYDQVANIRHKITDARDDVEMDDATRKLIIRVVLAMKQYEAHRREVAALSAKVANCAYACAQYGREAIDRLVNGDIESAIAALYQAQKTERQYGVEYWMQPWLTAQSLYVYRLIGDAPDAGAIRIMTEDMADAENDELLKAYQCGAKPRAEWVCIAEDRVPLSEIGSFVTPLEAVNPS